MAIYLPGTAEDQALALEEMTPRQIVAELDKYVVGQHDAKRAVAIALRNRTRRQRLPAEMAEEIMPKNILMIGSTGVGKTEIARRLAKLTNSPFLKVEASKFTEVGYVGRDVESMVRDLVEIAIDMVREEKLEEVEDRAEFAAEEKLIELLLQQGGSANSVQGSSPEMPGPDLIHRDETARGGASGAESGADAGTDKVVSIDAAAKTVSEAERQRERERLLMQFREGKLDERMVELEMRDRNQPQVEIISNIPDDMEAGSGKDPGASREPGGEMSGIREMLAGVFGQRTRRRTMKVADAFDYLVQEEEGRLLDMEQVTRMAVERVEESGIVFLDEIDKIAGREGGHGPDISREGVQRDILPIVEGTTVSTKYGFVTTDHILFVAAGAFHVSKPSDLIPELQGRFPIRVELKALTVEDFLRILTEPRASLVKQAVALLETEGLLLEFAPEALEEMARFAFEVNESTENIGARRLHTIMERVLDEISFEAPDLAKAADEGRSLEALPPVEVREMEKAGEVVAQKVVVVDRAYVQKQVAGIVKNQDLSRYIL